MAIEQIEYPGEWDVDIKEAILIDVRFDWDYCPSGEGASHEAGEDPRGYRQTALLQPTHRFNDPQLDGCFRTGRPSWFGSGKVAW